MGTRGFITFVVGGEEKTAYNQFDSYPSGLGCGVLTWLRDAVSDLDGLKKQAVALRVVGENSKPTVEDIKRLAGFANLSVGTQRADDWYCLLRETQGRPDLMLKAGVIEDAKDFPVDSLFAEWGYVVDLDAGVFEVYEGFQSSAHNKGRFAGRGVRPSHSGDYHPVALRQAWAFADLPTDEAFLDLLEPSEGGDE